MICSPEHRELALKTAREAIVLLKNKDAFLPFDRTKLKRIAVIGPHAADIHAGAYSGKPINRSTRSRASKTARVQGLKFSTPKDVTLRRSQTKGTATNSTTEAADDETAQIKAAAEIARQADVAIVFPGTTKPSRPKEETAPAWLCQAGRRS